MSGRRQKSACIAATFLILSLPASAARAEGFLEFLFGGFGQHMQQQPEPPPSVGLVTARPTALTVRPRYSATGHGTVFCVRTCDGRYFPIPRSATAQPAQICNSLCPASTTKVFSGSDISRAVAPDGSRYAALDHAFLYRQRTVDGCTCNGVTSHGLAAMDVRDDPTLQPGDLIATADGLVRSADLLKAVQKVSARRDDDVTTSGLPLGMRGNLPVMEGLPLRRSGPGHVLRIARPAMRPTL